MGDRERTIDSEVDEMTEPEILNEIERSVNVDQLDCATASTKINCQLRAGGKLYRFSGGPWCPTLRGAVAAYHERRTKSERADADNDGSHRV